MTRDEFDELSLRIVGKHATVREIDDAWHCLGQYPVALVVGFLSRSSGQSVRDLTAACQRQTLARAAREREPERCEHGHIDAPFDLCAECQPQRAEKAHRGAALVRAALVRAALAGSSSGHRNA